MKTSGILENWSLSRRSQLQEVVTTRGSTVFGIVNNGQLYIFILSNQYCSLYKPGWVSEHLEMYFLLNNLFFCVQNSQGYATQEEKKDVK